MDFCFHPNGILECFIDAHERKAKCYRKMLSLKMIEGSNFIILFPFNEVVFSGRRFWKFEKLNWNMIKNSYANHISWEISKYGKPRREKTNNLLYLWLTRSYCNKVLSYEWKKNLILPWPGDVLLWIHAKLVAGTFIFH